MEENQIHCPKCGSTQITAQKKGFSGAKAAAGVILTGGIGLLAGTIGSNKINITCLNCGSEFKPGESKKTIPQPKLIWSEVQKKHIINPEYNRDINSAPLSVVILVIVVIILVTYFILR